MGSAPVSEIERYPKTFMLFGDARKSIEKLVARPGIRSSPWSVRQLLRGRHGRARVWSLRPERKVLQCNCLMTRSSKPSSGAWDLQGFQSACAVP